METTELEFVWGKKRGQGYRVERNNREGRRGIARKNISAAVRWCERPLQARPHAFGGATNDGQDAEHGAHSIDLAGTTPTINEVRVSDTSIVEAQQPVLGRHYTTIIVTLVRSPLRRPLNDRTKPKI